MSCAMHEANRRHWDALAAGWRALRDADGLWRRCPTEPTLAFAGEALAFVRRYAAGAGGTLTGKRACVVGSGDNYAAFALAGMGAQVTSTDISQRQLDTAAERAAAMGLEMTFVRADAAVLDGVPDGAFDLAVSTNGLFVWIAEPAAVARAVARVLKPGGVYVFYDVHPFQRPWHDAPGALAMAQSYWDIGPWAYDDAAPEADAAAEADAAREADAATAGTISYEFTWTMADLLNALADAGLVIRQIAESPAADARFWAGASYAPGGDAALLDWHMNPRAGLPVWLTVCAER